MISSLQQPVEHDEVAAANAEACDWQLNWGRQHRFEVRNA
jgi:hypothetical protein